MSARKTAILLMAATIAMTFLLLLGWLRKENSIVESRKLTLSPDLYLGKKVTFEGDWIICCPRDDGRYILVLRGDGDSVVRCGFPEEVDFSTFVISGEKVRLTGICQRLEGNALIVECDIP